MSDGAIALGVQPVELPVRLFPPAQWENLDQFPTAGVLLPTIGARAVIISFKVPIGRNGIIKKIANNFVGGGFQEWQGNIIWRILVDGAPPPGANSYEAITCSLGAPASPTEIAGFRIFENQTVQLVADNIAIVVAGQFVGGRLVGYLYPREFDADDVWI